MSKTDKLTCCWAYKRRRKIRNKYVNKIILDHLNTIKESKQYFYWEWWVGMKDKILHKIVGKDLSNAMTLEMIYVWQKGKMREKTGKKDIASRRTYNEQSSE